MPDLDQITKDLNEGKVSLIPVSASLSAQEEGLTPQSLHVYIDDVEIGDIAKLSLQSHSNRGTWGTIERLDLGMPDPLAFLWKNIPAKPSRLELRLKGKTFKAFLIIFKNRTWLAEVDATLIHETINFEIVGLLSMEEACPGQPQKKSE